LIDHGVIPLFRLTSLNLNGIRSAATKGVEPWIAATVPDCICVQEVKAQAADVQGRFEQLAGLQGHFHFAEKKGYSGVGVYTRHEPSDVIAALAAPSSTPKAATWNCALTHPSASCPSSARTFPAAPRAKSGRRPSSAFWSSSTHTSCAPRRNGNSSCAAT
jgi:exodeoxyribonuclease-3